ncbi:hypothetical protein BVI434_1660032 [Burkholderia vietnamiensis]|nr:hypothetical protein BVI434_1660032 [Burkholderia vietnamiensis]
MPVHPPIGGSDKQTRHIEKCLDILAAR